CAVFALSRLSRNASASVEVTGSRTCRSCGAARGSTAGSAPRENRRKPVGTTGPDPGGRNRFRSVGSFMKWGSCASQSDIQTAIHWSRYDPPKGEKANSNGARGDERLSKNLNRRRYRSCNQNLPE